MRTGYACVILAILCILLGTTAVADIENLDRKEIRKTVLVHFSNTTSLEERSFSVSGRVKSVFPWVYGKEEDVQTIVDIVPGESEHAVNYTLDTLTVTILDAKNKSLGSDSWDFEDEVLEPLEYSPSSLTLKTVANTGNIVWMKFALKYTIGRTFETKTYTDSIWWNVTEFVAEQQVSDISPSKSRAGRGENITISGTVNFWEKENLTIEGTSVPIENGEFSYTYSVPKTLSGGEQTIMLLVESDLHPGFNISVPLEILGEIPEVSAVSLSTKNVTQGEKITIMLTATDAEANASDLTVTLHVDTSEYAMKNVNNTFSYVLNTSDLEEKEYNISVTVEDVDGTVRTPVQTIYVSAKSVSMEQTEQNASAPTDTLTEEKEEDTDSLTKRLTPLVWILGGLLGIGLIALIYKFAYGKEDEERELPIPKLSPKEKGYFAATQRLKKEVELEEDRKKRLGKSSKKTQKKS